MIKRVWVNGTFDILHIGHIKLLQYAASLGELRVGIDTDSRVKERKGQDRPFNNTKDRMTMLMALKSVNDVKTFSSREEMLKLIREWNPDYMVVGSDYKDKEVVGSELVKELIFFNRISDYSTTKILG
jgi:D-beta-D-heptose 7-phosphate kinase/D-beta-D-heptose 1-phosphate adenosyltransferase